MSAAIKILKDRVVSGAKQVIKSEIVKDVKEAAKALGFVQKGKQSKRPTQHQTQNIRKHEKNNKEMAGVTVTDGLSRSKVHQNKNADVHTTGLVREKVCDIFGAQGNMNNFLVTKFKLTPASPYSFPTLAIEAANHMLYRPRTVKFCYETEAFTATASSSQDAGKIILATSPDADEETFTNEDEMLRCYGSTWGPTYAPELKHDALKSAVPDARGRYYYVDYLANLYDDKFTTFGTFQIATSGGVATDSTKLGTLYVEYEFEFSRPQLTKNAIVPKYYYRLVSGAPTPAAPLTSPTIDSNSYPIPLNINSPYMYGPYGAWDNNGTTVINFPSSTTGVAWLISAYATGTSVIGAIAVSSTGMSPYNIVNSTNYYQVYDSGQAATEIALVQNQNNSTIILSGSATTFTYFQIIITPVNSADITSQLLGAKGRFLNSTINKLRLQVEEEASPGVMIHNDYHNAPLTATSASSSSSVSNVYNRVKPMFR